MRKRHQRKSSTVTNNGSEPVLTYQDNVRTPDTMYTLHIVNTTTSDKCDDTVFEVKQVAVASGNVLCHDVIPLVDVLRSLSYNFNCTKVTLCCGLNYYDFDRQQLYDLIRKDCLAKLN